MIALNFLNMGLKIYDGEPNEVPKILLELQAFFIQKKRMLL